LWTKAGRRVDARAIGQVNRLGEDSIEAGLVDCPVL